MKNKKIISAMTLAITGLVANVTYAGTDTTNAPKVQLSTQSDKSNIGTANAFEKEVTPLLREISRKRSALDIRKLDRELEKLDEDAAKAQAEKEKSALTLQITAQNAAQSAAAAAKPLAPVNPTPSATIPQNVRVLMIYGYEIDLYAKIAVGKEGGYPIRKGDILPDGRLVTGVTPNYVEVTSGKGKKAATDRLVVMGPSDLPDGTNTVGNNNASSVSAAPVPLTPSSALPAVSGPTSMVVLPQVMPAKLQ